MHPSVKVLDSACIPSPLYAEPSPYSTAVLISGGDAPGTERRRWGQMASYFSMGFGVNLPATVLNTNDSARCSGIREQYHSTRRHGFAKSGRVLIFISRNRTYRSQQPAPARKLAVDCRLAAFLHVHGWQYRWRKEYGIAIGIPARSTNSYLRARPRRKLWGFDIGLKTVPKLSIGSATMSPRTACLLPVAGQDSGPTRSMSVMVQLKKFRPWKR